MSGKAPPTGPRALLNSLNGIPSKRQPPQADLSSSSHPSPSSSSPSSSSSIPLINRIGAAPPTGPRSLLNGNTNALSRSAKPTLNGHANPLAGQPRQPPSGPSAMQQKPPLKGKQVEIKWSDQAIASTVSLLFRRPFRFILIHLNSLATLNLVPLPTRHDRHLLPYLLSMENLLQVGRQAFQQSLNPSLSLSRPRLLAHIVIDNLLSPQSLRPRHHRP
jgi:hypothetical protein